jgi:4-amino-4-deoxychorismate lyase
MVKFFSTDHTYTYSFPAVSLAYFLRYPNPYSTHVLSTDVISRSIDPETGRLSTTRLHVKRSRIPPAAAAIISTTPLGGSVSRSGSSSSYILETSTIDIKEGWMETESRNLDWTGILSVTERQVYRRELDVNQLDKYDFDKGTTGVTTTVTFRSRIGDRLRARRAREEEEPKQGWLASWSASGIQRSIEAIASQRTSTSQGKSRQGMNVVLERLRNGGLMAVLEGMRKDRESVVRSSD